MSDKKDKFDPVQEFINLRDSIKKTAEETIRTVTGMPEATNGHPLLDIYETDSAVLIRTSFLNGIQADSLEISVENNVLTLSGSTVDNLDVKDTQFLHRELKFGAFSRSVPIPRKVEADQASAKFKKGVLTITLPKIQDDSPEIVDVTPAE